MEAGVGCGNELDTFIYIIISLTLHNVYMTTSSFLGDLDSEEEARVGGVAKQHQESRFLLLG